MIGRSWRNRMSALLYGRTVRLHTQDCLLRKMRAPFLSLGDPTLQVEGKFGPAVAGHVRTKTSATKIDRGDVGRIP